MIFSKQKNETIQITRTLIDFQVFSFVTPGIIFGTAQDAKSSSANLVNINKHAENCRFAHIYQRYTQVITSLHM